LFQEDLIRGKCPSITCDDRSNIVSVLGIIEISRDSEIYVIAKVRACPDRSGKGISRKSLDSRAVDIRNLTSFNANFIRNAGGKEIVSDDAADIKSINLTSGKGILKKSISHLELRVISGFHFKFKGDRSIRDSKADSQKEEKLHLEIRLFCKN